MDQISVCRSCFGIATARWSALRPRITGAPVKRSSVPADHAATGIVTGRPRAPRRLTSFAARPPRRCRVEEEEEEEEALRRESFAEEDEEAATSRLAGAAAAATAAADEALGCASTTRGTHAFADGAGKGYASSSPEEEEWIPARMASTFAALPPPSPGAATPPSPPTTTLLPTPPQKREPSGRSLGDVLSSKSMKREDASSRETERDGGRCRSLSEPTLSSSNIIASKSKAEAVARSNDALRRRCDINIRTARGTAWSSLDSMSQKIS